jgi:hypothetical protein
MRKHSEHFELALIVFGFALTWLFKTMYEGLFYAWTLKQLERYLGLQEAEVIAKFSEIALPFAASVATILVLYRYIHRDLATPRISLLFNEEQEDCKNPEPQGIYVHVLAFNDGALPIDDCEAVLETVTRDGKSVGYKSPKNLSWARPPDGSPEKFGKIRLADGNRPNPIDVLAAGTVNGASFICPMISDPARRGYVEQGIYRLGIKVSTSGAASAEIALLVDWKGNPHKIHVRAE